MFKLFINYLSTFEEERVGEYHNKFFSEADKAIIKHHEKGCAAYKIWKANPEKHCNKTSVKRHIKRF